MTEWRPSGGRWIVRQGPLAALLAALFTLDVLVAAEAGVPGLFLVQWFVAPVCALVLVAERRPVRAVLGAAVVLAGGSVVLSLTGDRVITVVGPLTTAETAAVALLIAAVVRRAAPWAAAAATGTLVLAAVLARLLRPPVVEGWIHPWWYDSAEGVLLLLFVVFVGGYLRNRDREQRRATQWAGTTARQRERLILARELHDVVAHHVGALVVHAQAAQVVAGSDPGAGRRALPAIEATGREALDAMRRLVTALRETDSAAAAPALTADLLADLGTVTTPPVWDGPPVRLSAELAEPVPAEVATSVLRIVREALANARRHASGAHEIAVSVRAEDGLLWVRVVDDGLPGPVDEGYGLIGMRERVRLLGGRFSAGRTDAGGWQVSAEVPLTF